MNELSRAEKTRRDKDLVRQCLKGCNAAFGELMRLNIRALKSLGMSFFHNESDADDFVQDVFIKAYTHLDTFKGGSLFSTWLIRIGYNTAINALDRRKEYLPLADEDIIADSAATPEESEISRATQEAVRQATRELPENYKVCVDMYFFYGMNYKEICEATGFPIGTIKSHIFRAKKILKDKLEDLL